jgi:hypothetical protein
MVARAAVTAVTRLDRAGIRRRVRDSNSTSIIPAVATGGTAAGAIVTAA